MDVPTVMLVCLKYNRIIRGFGGYCTTDLRGIVGKGGCRKFGSGRHEGIFIHGGTESGGEIYEKESGKSFRGKCNVLTDENTLSISVEEEALVWDWIDALPTERRNIFLMAKQQGMKYKEIAVQLDISVKTVEGQMGKALKALRDKAIKIYLFFFG